MLEYFSGGGSGDRIPLIKFSAMDGRFRTSDRVNEGGQWRSEDAEITMPTQFVMDFENIELGWIAYKPQPDFIVVKYGEPKPPKPDAQDQDGNPLYKDGFRIRLGNPSTGLREFSSTSGNVFKALGVVFGRWQAEKAANPGMMPVVEITGTNRTDKGWHVPVWDIVKWVPAPDFMTGEETAPAAEQAVPAPSPAPAAAPQPPAAAGTDLF